MLRSTFVLCLALAFASAAVARDIFVDNIGGDDAFEGDFAELTTGYSGPVRTINKAIRLTLPGDRIVLANTAQPYRECVTLQGERNSGYSTRPLVLEGNGAILDGSLPVPEEAWEFVSGDTFRFQPARMAHQQLFNEGKPLVRKNIPADGSVPKLAPMEWCLHAGWVYFRGTPRTIPQQFALTHAGMQTGITMYKVHDVVIHNLTVQGYQLDGISAHDGVRNGRLLNITSRGNGRAGVCVAGGSRAEIAGCTLGDNGAAQLLVEEYSLTRVMDSLLIANTAPAIVRRGEARLYVDGQLWKENQLLPAQQVSTMPRPVVRP